MKHLFILIILLLLVGCSSGPKLTSDILDRYEMAFTQGYIWATGIVLRDYVVTVNDFNDAMELFDYHNDLYRDAFTQGAYHCFDYATTKINTRDVWLSNRINFLTDSLELR